MRRVAAAASVLVLGTALALWAGCKSNGGNAPATGNVLANGSFEAGAEPWFSLQTAAWGKPFAVTQRRAHSGTSSALLQLRSQDGGPARVYGVVQEVSPSKFPEVLSGSYYVDGWQQGTPKQYLQAVVIVWGAHNQPAEAGAVDNYQIRYVLAGVDRAPLAISNARYVMVGTGAPQGGRWVTFERNVRQDFLQLWGGVPEGFDNLRIFFEVRWDERSDSDAPSAADVYYDDLYLGTASATPP